MDDDKDSGTYVFPILLCVAVIALWLLAYFLLKDDPP